jgi:hypothetical protein
MRPDPDCPDKNQVHMEYTASPKSTMKSQSDRALNLENWKTYMKAGKIIYN